MNLHYTPVFFNNCENNEIKKKSSAVFAIDCTSSTASVWARHKQSPRKTAVMAIC